MIRVVSSKKLRFCALLLLLLGTIGCQAKQKWVVIKEQVVDGEFDDILIETNNLGVKVFPASGQTGTVKLYANKPAREIDTFSVQVAQATLKVKAEKKHSAENINFMVEILLPVKAYVALMAEGGNGSVQIDNLQVEKVEINIDNGVVTLKSITAAEVSAETKNGQLLFADVSGTIRGRTGNGQIRLSAERIDRWPINLSTGNGNILVYTARMPANATIDAQSGIGNIIIFASRSSRTGKWTDGNGENLILLRTGNGSIKVERR